jgi:hypothetical protein
MILTFIISIILYRSKYVNNFFLMSSLIDLDREAEVFMSRRGVWAGRESLMYDVRGFFERGLRISRVDLITDITEYPQIRAYYESGQGTMILSELRADNRDDIYTELIRELETLGEVVF